MAPAVVVVPDSLLACLLRPVQLFLLVGHGMMSRAKPERRVSHLRTVVDIIYIVASMMDMAAAFAQPL